MKPITIEEIVEKLWKAIWHYNHSEKYVNDVLTIAKQIGY